MPIVDNIELLKYLQASGAVVTSAAQAMLSMIQPMIESMIAQRLGYNPAQATYTEFYPSNDSNAYYADDNQIGANYDMVNSVVVTHPRGTRQQKFLALRALPARSITSVYENYAAWYTGVDGGEWPVTSLLPSNCYYLDLNRAGLSWTGQLVKVMGVWPGALRTVKVTYVAGLTAAELATTHSGIKMAALTAITEAYAEVMSRGLSANFGGKVQSIGIEDFSLSLGPINSGSDQQSAFVALSTKASAMLAPYIDIGNYIGIN